MSTIRTTADPREALSESEREASRQHPENFKEDETDEKVVEILPIDGEGAAIKGIDPEK
ncbi:MAG: hypothetical protein ABI781_04530 [Burkholderiales bacterium]